MTAQVISGSRDSAWTTSKCKETQGICVYLIIEGMPSSGKTILANTLTDCCQGTYFKSLLLDDGFGKLMRRIWDAALNSTESDLLHMVDFFRNECTISKMLAEGKSVAGQMLPL